MGKTPKTRVRGKTPDREVSYRTKSPDPKRLKKAEKEQAKSKSKTVSSKGEAVPGPAILKAVATPQKSVARKLTFSDVTTVHPIQAENSGTVKATKNKKKMTEAEADAILESLEACTSVS